MVIPYGGSIILLTTLTMMNAYKNHIFLAQCSESYKKSKVENIVQIHTFEKYYKFKWDHKNSTI